MTVSALKDSSGISIRSVANEGAISKDGRLKVGDGILALNGESAGNLTTAQARAMLRRHSLIGPELRVTYVPAAFLDMHQGIQSKQGVRASRATVVQSKQELKLNKATVVQSKNIKLGHAAVVQPEKETNPGQATVSQFRPDVKTGRSTAAQSFQGHKTIDKALTKRECIPEQSKEDGERANGKRGRENELIENTTRLRCSRDGGKKDKQERDRDALHSHQGEGWKGDETGGKTEGTGRDQESWSHPRRVTLIRTHGESLGISVFGGRGMGCRLSNGEMRRGIFIKHISDNSPAARDNTLTAGERILQVGGVDLSDFTHEEAVEAIRQAGDKVELLVQSLQLPGNTGSGSTLTDDVTSTNGLERLHGPSDTKQHWRQGQESYWDHTLQKYGSLPGVLKLVELDCSTHRPGLGVCVSQGGSGRRVCVSELRPDGAAAAAAGGRIRVGDELLEINGQVLSCQNAAAVINTASSKVKIVLIRYEAAPAHTATGSIIKAENTITPPPDVEIDTNRERRRDATEIQEERMRLDKLQLCPSNSQSTNPAVSCIASSNHDPRHEPASFPPTSLNTHRKQSCCNSLTSPAASGMQSAPYCSACSVGSDPLTRPIVPGCINIIDICKGHGSLGLTIVGGCNTSLGMVLIHEVNEGGAAHRDGRLIAGDHLLEVNGIDLRMASHEEALSVLRLSPQHVRLCVFRHTSIHTFQSQATHTLEDMWDLFTVHLQLEPGQELGMSIVGKRNDTGIFVSEISPGGVVESDGRLSLGDQILSVNGQDIRAVTQDHACSLLQTCSGSVLLEVARFRATPHYSYQCQNNRPGWRC